MNKERIVVIPKEVQEKIDKEGLGEEFDKVIDKLQKGEIVGTPMDCQDLKVKLLCAECGTKNIMWYLEKNSNEVYYMCKDCKFSGWMYLGEYNKALKNNPECVFEDE